MYIPASFERSDPDELHALVERHGFGLLVSQHDGEPLASHLPLLLERGAGRRGCLVGHMAKANPQWRQADGQTVLATFSGPHAYVSPSWYEAQDVVPTWNYAAVHVYGRFQAIDDAQALVEIVRGFVAFYERNMPVPWQMPEDDFIHRMTQSIVGFRIPIDRIEGKWKLSQNQPAERRQKVIAALDRRGDENSLAVAEMMRKLNDVRT